MYLLYLPHRITWMYLLLLLYVCVCVIYVRSGKKVMQKLDNKFDFFRLTAAVKKQQFHLQKYASVCIVCFFSLLLFPSLTNAILNADQFLRLNCCYVIMDTTPALFFFVLFRSFVCLFILILLIT